jgi:hypothetical protein
VNMEEKRWPVLQNSFKKNDRKQKYTYKGTASKKQFDGK